MIYNVLVAGESVSQHRKWHPAFVAAQRVAKCVSSVNRFEITIRESDRVGTREYDLEGFVIEGSRSFN